jgi:hypothetical protein
MLGGGRVGVFLIDVEGEEATMNQARSGELPA